MANSLNLQCLLGMRCADFAMIAADQTNTQSVIVVKNDENKLHQVTDKLIMGLVGDPGDAGQFAHFISKNLQLYKMRNKYGLDAAAVVHFTRKNLAEGLRLENPAVLNMLVVSHDDQLGGQLFSLDMLAASIEAPFAVHGFGGHLSMGVLDRYHRYNLTEGEAYEILKLCVREVHQRLIISLPNFQVKVVSKTGIKQLPTINCYSFTPQKCA